MTRTRPAARLLKATGTLICTLLVTLGLITGPSMAQGLDISGWTIEQANSTSVYTIPSGTVLQPGGYLVLGRFADQAAFESFWGVTLGTNVVYVTNASEAPAVPMINGDETFTVKNAGGAVIDGPTPLFDLGNVSHQRNDPEAAPWTLDTDTSTPGYGVEAQDAVFSGLVISEASDGPGSGNYIYEFVELYYDADAGTGGNLAPSVSITGLDPDSPTEGDDITFTASITDSDGTISQADLYYRYDGSAFSSTAMTGTGGDTYEAVVTGVPGNVVMEYYVRAVDDDGAAATDPVDVPTTYYSVWISGSGAGSRVIVFDHSHDQDAGTSGNWRIDDNFPDPYPATPTSETSWNGQLSSWGYELYQLGYTVRSNTAAISATGLAGVDLLVIPEPQTPFTAAEIEAVRQFVYDGGSLCFIADHNSSDRNGNGWDSPSIFGGYTYPHISDPVGSDTETFCGALFGLHVHVKDEGYNGISGTYTNVNSDPQNPVIHGPYGNVASIVYHVGNTMSLWPTANSDLSEVAGLVSLDTGSYHMAAWSRYGDGKVFGYGDSSDTADGTGSETHVDNWHEADHRALFLNATMWLLDKVPVSGVDDLPAPFGVDMKLYPNPFNPQLTVAFELDNTAAVDLGVYDVAGRLVRTLHQGTLTAGPQRFTWNGRDDAGRTMGSGVYLVRINDGVSVTMKKVVLAK